MLTAKIPPLVVLGVSALLMWLTAAALPTFALDFAARPIIALALAFAGVLISVSGVIVFRLAGTTVNPTKPGSTSSLVRNGPYRVTRNPMYLGFALMLIGWGLFLSNVLALCFLAVFGIYIDRFQIAPEEAALTARFGREFIAYKARVRRWL